MNSNTILSSHSSRSIPANYKVFFMQGGGTGQFAAVPLNLLRGHETADYLISGVWTQKAFQEVIFL